MTIDRADVRKQFATRLEQRFGATAKVYGYQTGDFNGASPVIIVTNSGTGRATPWTAGESSVHMEVHTFVVYALPPVLSTGNVVSGLAVEILLDDTSMFTVGQTVTVEEEECVVTIIDPDVSITVDALTQSYTTPRVYVWTESQSEDMIDDLEYQIADEVRESNEADLWSSISNTDVSEIDVVDVGGEPYRHETINVVAVIQDF